MLSFKVLTGTTAKWMYMLVTSEKFYARKGMGTVQNLLRKQTLSIVQLVHINNSPKSLKQCSVRSPTKFISAGITKRSSNAPNLPSMRTHFAAVSYSVEFASHNKSMWRYMMKEVNWARLKSDIQKKNRPFLVKYTADPTLLRLAGNQELIRPVNRNLQFWNMRHA